MINSAIHIFDSIGCSFTVKNGQLVIGSPLKGYKSLDNSHIGSYIPYLLRNYPENKDIEWEVGIGTYTSSGTTLSRTTVLSSSNSGSLVNFSAGTKNVFVTYPASVAVPEGKAIIMAMVFGY